MDWRYSLQRSQSNGKNNSQNKLTNQKFDSYSKSYLAYREQHNVEPITLFLCQYVPENAKQFWSLRRSHHYGIFMDCHHGTGRAQRWHPAVTCNVTVAIGNTTVIVAYLPSNHTKLFLWLCNINEWWRGHRSHTLARFGHNFVCRVTYLPISPQGRARFKLSYRGNLQQPVEFKIVRTERKLRTEPPVELPHCNTSKIYYGWPIFKGVAKIWLVGTRIVAPAMAIGRITLLLTHLPLVPYICVSESGQHWFG